MLLVDSTIHLWLAQVYDNLVFDDLEFTHMATLPGMWDRTLTLSSIGKTFSVTGWKVISKAILSSNTYLPVYFVGSSLFSSIFNSVLFIGGVGSRPG